MSDRDNKFPIPIGWSNTDWLALPEWRKQRKVMLESLNMHWARAFFERPQYTGEMSDYALLVAMHKARVEVKDCSANHRFESLEWLRERNFKRIGGLDLPPVGDLPE